LQTNYSASEAAHKFNNILGSIRGYAEQLRKKHENNEEIVRYTDRILLACDKGVEFSSSLSNNRTNDSVPSANTYSETEQIQIENRLPNLLLVDDDEMLIDMFKEVFRELNIPCTFFTNGKLAIDFFVDNHKGIDAVIIDMAMPIMNGKELFYELRKINNKKPIIVLSGYSSNDDVDELTKNGALHFKKPVTIDELIKSTCIVAGLNPNWKHQQEQPYRPINTMAQVAIVDDDPLFGDLLLDILSDHGLSATLYTDPRHFMESVDSSSHTLALIDYKMPHINGFEVITKLRKNASKVQTVLITGITGGSELLSDAKKLGITCLFKPLDVIQLVTTLEGVFPTIKELERNKPKEEHASSKMIVGMSVPIIRTRQLIERVGRSEANLMIYGETGSGKELAARMIHSESPRSSEPFIPVNCPSLPDNLLESELFGYEKGAFTGAHQTKKGLFEWADRGTLFLDEIGDLNYILQAKILRAVQERKIRRVGGQEEFNINVRIISATNKNLEEMISAGAFREDLYYRLNVVKIVMPTLRERKDDIPLLVRHFMQRYNKRENNKKINDISLEVLNILRKHDWPGNVRELENALNEMFILASGSRVTVKDIPARLRNENTVSAGNVVKDEATIPITDYMEKAKREYLISLLKKTNGNVSIASKESCMNRAALHRVLTGLKIEPEQYRQQK
jgi:DNA-binding NtrC family response regulator